MTRMALYLASSALVASALTGCGNDTMEAPPAASRASSTLRADTSMSAAVEQDLATLRRLVAPFHRFDAAVAAGWNVQLTPCLSNPSQGAMGYHYANTALIDATVSVDEPELLLYEPLKNGGLRFVAVEYIIPFTLLPADATPPVLFGQSFHQNFEVGLWALHVWVGRHNPAGLFADWNPDVSCQYATQ